MDAYATAQFWVVIAAIALITELFTLAFFALFLGIGAAVTALLTWLGLTPSFSAQLLAFAVISLGSLAFFRKFAINMFGKNEKSGAYKEFIGDPATVAVEIPAGGEGKIRYRGTEWIAISANGQAIAADTPVRIKKMDGIKAVVEA